MSETRDNRVPVPDILLICAARPLRDSWTRSLRGLGIAVSISEVTSLHEGWARLGSGWYPDLILLDAGLAVTPAGASDPESVRLDCAVALGVLRRQRLVLIGAVPEPGIVRTLVQSGARGYLFERRVGAQDGPDAARPRHQTVTVINTRGVPGELSLREIEVLQHAADGRSNTEIGLALHLSPLTVKSHLGRIGRKLGSGNRAHLVLLALRSGVVR